MTERENTPRLRRGCRITSRGLIDGRSKEAAALRRSHAELIEHLGGNATLEQRVLIERISFLRLQLDNLDRGIAAGREVDPVLHLSLTNSLARLLRRLGPANPPPAPSFHDVLAEIAARRGQGEAA